MASTLGVSTVSIYEGLLAKKGQRWKTWKRRYFVLRTTQKAAAGCPSSRRTQLLYYKKEGDNEPLQSMEVQGVIDVPDPFDLGGRLRPHRFDVVVGADTVNNRVLCLAATSGAEKQRWIQQISSATTYIPLVQHPRAAEFQRRRKSLEINDNDCCCNDTGDSGGGGGDGNSDGDGGDSGDVNDKESTEHSTSGGDESRNSSGVPATSTVRETTALPPVKADSLEGALVAQDAEVKIEINSGLARCDSNDLIDDLPTQHRRRSSTLTLEHEHRDLPSTEAWEKLGCAINSTNYTALISAVAAMQRQNERLQSGDYGDGSNIEYDALKAQWSDLVSELHSHVHAARRSAHLVNSSLSHEIAKEERERMYGYIEESVFQLFNKAGDIGFLVVHLWSEDTFDLFYISLTALVLSALLRLFFCYLARKRVNWEDKTARKWFWYGTAASLVEPVSGSRMLKKSYTSTDSTGRTVYVAGQGYVDGTADSQASRAANNLLTARTELRNSLALIGVEDLPQFIIEAVFLIRTGEETLDTLFFVTTLGTLLHMIRLFVEVWQLRKEIPRLWRLTQYSDKAFNENVEDDEVIAYAKLAALDLCVVNLRRCKKITDRSVTTLAAYCMNLKKIDLRRCSGLTDASAKAIARHCLNVREVALSCSTNITDVGVCALARSCQGITSFSRRCCPGTTDTSILVLAQYCRGLTELELHGCEKITDKSLNALAQYCPHLATVYFAKCDITDGGMIALAGRCAELRLVSVSDCVSLSDDTLRALGRHCPYLKDVYFRRCKKISDEGVTGLAQGCKRLSRLFFDDCERLTDQSLHALAEHCSSLQSIDLTGCHEITDDGVCSLALRCPKLIKIWLIKCPKITDTSLTALATHCSAIEAIDVAGCHCVTDDGVEIVAKQCGTLKKFVLKECPQITDHGVKSLANKNCALETLDLRKNANITDSALSSLSSSRKLAKLQLDGCVCVTRKAVDNFKQRCCRDNVKVSR